MHGMRIARLLATVLAAACVAPLEAQRDTVTLDTLRAAVLRTELPARRAPFAVSEARGERLTRARPGLSLNQALVGIPGVQVDNRFNPALGERISIRGAGARTQFGVRGVRILVDGIPATLPDGQSTLNHVDPASLSRAEVLRGPGAALYGNASGGVIRLTTVAPPDSAASEVEATALAGGDGLRRVQAAAAARRGAAWAGAHASHAANDGFREWSRASSTALTAAAGWDGARDRLRVSLNAVDYDARNPGSLPDSVLRANRRAAWAANVAQRTGEAGRQGQLGVEWTRAVAGGSLETGAWGTARSIENPIPQRIIALDRWVAGGRAAWSGAAEAGPAALRWTAGAEAERQDDTREVSRNEGGRPGGRVLDQRERVTATAAFAQATATVGRVDVLGALRYDRFAFRVTDRFVEADGVDESGRRTMDAWSPALGVSLSLPPVLVAYANVATAFETPTTTELANRPSGAGGFNPDLAPQRATTTEVGLRAFPTLETRLELAVYRATVEDALVPFEVEGAPGRQFFRNAGRSVHRGVEAAAEGTWRAVSVRAAYTWTDARFDRYVVGRDTLDGNRVPGVAPHRLDVAVAWTPVPGWTAGVDLRAASETPVDDRDRDGALAAPGHAVADVRVEWAGARTGGVRWAPFAGVTNVTDRDWVAAVTVNAFGRRYYEPGPGRALYAGVRVAAGR